MAAFLKRGALGVVIALVCLSGASAQPPEVFYAGKTIRLVVGVFHQRVQVPDPEPELQLEIRQKQFPVAVVGVNGILGHPVSIGIVGKNVLMNLEKVEGIRFDGSVDVLHHDLKQDLRPLDSKSMDVGRGYGFRLLSLLRDEHFVPRKEQIGIRAQVPEIRVAGVKPDGFEIPEPILGRYAGQVLALLDGVDHV